jgi:transposase
MVLPPSPIPRRGELSHAQWQRLQPLQPLLPPQKPRVGRPSLDHRTTINGILWVLRTGAPWRDLPQRYGAWATVSGRFYRWQRTGLWQQILQTLQQQADAEGKLNWQLHHVDGSVIRAHQHAAGAKKRLSCLSRVSCLICHSRWLLRFAISNHGIENSQQLVHTGNQGNLLCFPLG